MKPSELRQWMLDNSKNVLDVASATQFHPDTIRRFLDRETKTPHGSFLAALKKLVYGEKEAS